MSRLQDAISADRAGDMVAAAGAYEAALAAGERSLSAFLNLAILYWQATDFGISSSKRLEQKFIAHAGTRFPVLLVEAQRAFPQSTEPEFWRRFIRWADLGEDFPVDACRELLGRDPTTLIPAMHQFSLTQGREGRDQALELLRQIREDGTTRGRYVTSVLEGVLKRTAKQMK